MNNMARTFRDLATSPSGPAYVQAAALCLRSGPAGREVLLVQTLRLRQWVIPKGWPVEGCSLSESAAQEAWEEAGARGTIWPDAVGHFTYTKIKKSGLPVQCRAHVFRLDVTETAETYPEADKRARLWVPVARAAEMVRDAELRPILLALAAPQSGQTGGV